MAKFLMVLNDGETYTGLAGCKVVRVEEDEASQWALDDGEIPADAEVVATFSEQEERIVLTYERIKNYPLVRYSLDIPPSML